MVDRRQSLTFPFIFAAVFIVALGNVAALAQPDGCEWTRGDPHKMHWPQLPDLSDKGVDVSLAGIILADDFKCTASGPIRDIHLWGSFYKDVLPENGPDSLTFELRIYSDIPAEKDRWSRPGQLLWRRTFKPGQYSARRVHGGPEGWYDLVTNEFIPNNHRLAYQYDFCIEEEPYLQKEGTVYWLAVREVPETDSYVFGWKTTTRRLRWNDDAVYFNFDDLSWLELTYPKEHKYAGETLDLAFVITNGEESPPQADLGDAPDSSTSWPGLTMTAYPGVTAHFPTVYLEGSPPYGPLHKRPRDMYYLGRWVSLENEADIGPDEDPTNNLGDTLGVIYVAGADDAVAAAPWPHRPGDLDGADDGLRLPLSMPDCQETTLDYVVTVIDPSAQEVYVNVWCDWNRDGDWDDVLTCPDGETVPEWAVRNDEPLLPGPGEYVFTSSPFKCWHPAGDESGPIWVRISIAERPHLPFILIPGMAPGFEGSGPMGGYEYGETEDYYIEPEIEPTPAEAKLDWADAPDDTDAPGYPTLKDHDGARHVIAGPWLGNESDRPDPEDDGQPDLNALGDDNNASDDENGASVPPLVAGEPACVTVEVRGGGGVLQAWIDFNRDRAWYDSERVYNGFLPDGIHVIHFTVPADAVTGQSFARFRISRRGGLEPYGAAADGEVEDHEVRIHRPPANAKWCQWPDLTPYGIDIRVDRSDDHVRIVADDFECTNTSRLTHVRLWGSWKQDRKGEIKMIRLRIHPDDPVGSKGADKENKYSKPGPETLWKMEFHPGQFDEELYHVVSIGGEWWWDPNTGQSRRPGDTEVWQIDIDIDPDDAFLQEGTIDEPRIYWLSVDVETAEGSFGWKTRQWPQHFMDDAVWDVENMVPRIWRELRYPEGHRFHEHEKNSIDMAFCLAFASEGPEPVTCMPTCITQCPPVETTCPAILTGCPAEATRCPVVLTKCPAQATRCPTVLTECPAQATRCPPVETRCPATDTKCPPAQTRCPPVETECPSVATQCSGGVTQCPPVETRCPVQETKCPAILTNCPAVATNCPTSATQCPPMETRCPAQETKCPAALTKCPTMATRCPPVETQCPTEETQCPAVSTACPAVLTQCPATETRCPLAETKCPSIGTQCPAVATECPGGVTQCPPLETRCPAEETKCPPIKTKCPPVSTECPGVETQCPAPLTQCRPMQTQCPAAETMCPPEETQCPSLRTACPVVETQCPRSETKCPPVTTKCPPAETRCPATDTACPVILTQCPWPCKVGLTDTGGASFVVGPCPIVETRCLTVSQYLAMAQTRR